MRSDVSVESSRLSRQTSFFFEDLILYNDVQKKTMRSKFHVWKNKFLFLTTDGRLGYNDTSKEYIQGDAAKWIKLLPSTRFYICLHNKLPELSMFREPTFLEHDSCESNYHYCLFIAGTLLQIEKESVSEERKLSLKCADFAVLVDKEHNWTFRLSNVSECLYWIETIKGFMLKQYPRDPFLLTNTTCEKGLERGLVKRASVIFSGRSRGKSLSCDTTAALLLNGVQRDKLKEGYLMKRDIGSMGNEILKKRFVLITRDGKMFYARRPQVSHLSTVPFARTFNRKPSFSKCLICKIILCKCSSWDTTKFHR
ncbi:hypothetical protein Ciccas_009949 [Cichlidogyrus casuarinus]|uniref:PH domain-containing protein n=1 Tax=Cichlidogyrus casuarinus TaxID=1844966 RepID=A0ABD2PX30_9PLAT